MHLTLLVQTLFRLIGLAALCGGVYTIYYFGIKLLPLFQYYVAGGSDPFTAFSFLVSVFLGGPALVWMGMRMLVLRNFKPFWIYLASLAITVTLMAQYNIEYIFEMDALLTDGVLFVIIYVVVNDIVRFAKRKWYEPISHESARHIRLEEPVDSTGAWRTLILLILIITLLLLHPADIVTTLDMLVSPFRYAINLF